MGAQRLDRGIAAGKFGLGERGVDFPVAELVEKGRGSALAALELRDQVMKRPAPRRDRAEAERAYGRGVMRHGRLG